jgi:exopolyphosphatase / guanosine-5'-triphosphate,3'-diphosphate pyrophosphatase
MIAGQRGVIDIGSNAIRFVAYAGAPRAPVPIYNEKSPVSLGQSLLDTGRLPPETITSAVQGLVRFVRLAAMMQIVKLRIVATAAVRDAPNGKELIAAAADRGIKVDLLTGDQEALAAGMGVLSDAPWANGYVGDLGGGSLELVRVNDGKLGDRISLPMGTIRLRGVDEGDVAAKVAAAIDTERGFHIDPGLDLHLVGGTWRALMRLGQHFTGHPLDILANYALDPAHLPMLIDKAHDADAIRSLKIVPQQRVPAIAHAAQLAQALSGILQSKRLIASAGGIREGLLYDVLTKTQRSEDPLIACTRHEGERISRFGLSGDAIDDWMAPMFTDDAAVDRRVRNAACQLADCTWQIHPEHRASHARDMALFGNWVGIEAADRVRLAATLFAAHGGKGKLADSLIELVSDDAMSRARQWGLAIRLAMRLDAGTGKGLASAPLSIDAERVTLTLNGKTARLEADSVFRRLKPLASSLGREAVVVAE